MGRSLASVGTGHTLPGEVASEIVSGCPIVAGPRPARSRLARWLLAGLGVLCVGLGALGAVVPGLPTAVFLLGASWCFARSCPWLEERLLRVPLFALFLAYLEPGARIPRRTLAKALVIMWLAIVASAAAVGLGDDGRPGWPRRSSASAWWAARSSCAWGSRRTTTDPEIVARTHREINSQSVVAALISAST
jgi:uncharacterized membrane protein YbaN (DUF454 family)